MAFAGDVFRKVWDGSDGAEGVRRVLDESGQVLDEAQMTCGWARYESQREQVLDLRRKGLLLPCNRVLGLGKATVLL